MTLLHLPYTAWHLAYVAIGAGLASRLELSRLAWALLAFFLAVGIAAHCLDELHGRPLGTAVPRVLLASAAAAGLCGAAAIGVWGTRLVGLPLLVLVAVGVALVLAYNLELFGGAFHSDACFALAWGAFPVLVGGFAQTGSVELPVVIGAAFGAATSRAQRTLSNWARGLRRGAITLEGTVARTHAPPEPLEVAALAAPAEAALLASSFAHVLLAAALVAASLR